MKREHANAVLEHIETTCHESFRIKDDIFPHITTPLHYHEDYELVWIKKGAGKRIVGDHIDLFKENDMVLIGQNLPHVWKNDQIYYANIPNLMADVYVLHFSNKLLEGMMLCATELSDIRKILHLSRRGLRIIGKTNTHLSKVISNLLHASSIKRIILFLQVFEILQHSTEIVPLSSEEFAHFNNNQQSERLRKIYEYISKNFQHKISVEEISSVACISSTAFCRYFKKETGYSFISALNNFRLIYAQNLLNDNEYKISTVAQKSGFQDISYFNRMFKKKNGMAPTEYIKKLHNIAKIERNNF